MILLVVLVLVLVALLTQRRWEDKFNRNRWCWYLLAYPAAHVRIRFTWRRLCQTADLCVVRRPRHTLIGRDTYVRGQSLRPIPPRLGAIKATRNGLAVHIKLHPGQTPAEFVAALDAITHAWRMHSVRITSPTRGHLLVVAVVRDPLSTEPGALPQVRTRLLEAVLGRLGDGAAWVIDFRMVPHWLVVGATRSGKSNWLLRLARALASQPVALVGIDCKGGMELGLIRARLSALATDRSQALRVLRGLLQEAKDRMALCQEAAARSIWELPEGERPVSVVVLVDEIAELYLSDGSRETKAETAECASALLRLAQLGAALGIHLVVAAQRFGSELGPGATALRAQLAGRVCHRVSDSASAEMVLGDLSPDAVATALTIQTDDHGMSVTSVDGQWMRARSLLTTRDDARAAALRHVRTTPVLPSVSISLAKGGTE
ncbi:FtsK/SpoIIIE domain-containing protein [Streptomyces odontomachi]|uniref:FtsK/SpoIIIE domain-containing protein n=1 Tax=Streptomyces odontomachi TaxID=2944940 RepID=UPI0021098234|nr:FtsK/SpoIIIE domain-containing protein [Streptomyces sp. ODS25]